MDPWGGAQRDMMISESLARRQAARDRSELWRDWVDARRRWVDPWGEARRDWSELRHEALRDYADAEATQYESMFGYGPHGPGGWGSAPFGPPGLGGPWGGGYLPWW